MAGDHALFIVDTSTRLVTAAYESDPDLTIDRIAIDHDGHRIAALDQSGMVTVFDAANGSVIAQTYDDGALWSVAFAPDGASFVTTGNDGRVKLWDALTGERLLGDDFEVFPRWVADDHPSSRGSIDAVFSTDGEWVVSAGSAEGDGEHVFLWSMPDGRPLDAFGVEYHESYGLIEHVVVAPDRSWVAGSCDHKIHVWNTEASELIITLETQGTVTALAVAGDGSHLASGDSNGVLCVWEACRFVLQARLPGHGKVQSLGFSADGQLLYSGGGGEAREWDLRSPANLDPSRESIPVECVMPSPDGTWVAVAVQGGDVHIRDVASGRIRAILTGHDLTVRNIAIAPDGTWLATQARGTIFVWDTGGALARKFWVGNIADSISGLLVSADSRRLFTRDTSAVRAWDPWSGKPLLSMANRLTEVESLAFSHDGSWLAAGDYLGTIWVWNAETGDLHSTLGGGHLHARVKALAFASDNTLLAFPSPGGITTWDVQHAKIVNTTPAFKHLGGLEAAVSPDGVTVISCDHRMVRRYDLVSSELVIRDLRASPEAPLAFSGDGRWFAVGTSNTTKIWERATHRIHAHVGLGWPLVAVALTSHGDWLAAARPGSLAIWDTGKSEVVGEFPWRAGYYTNALACSREKHRLGIARDAHVVILDVTSGDERELVGDLGGVQAMSASPQGSFVATAGAKGVRLWDARNGRSVAAVKRELTHHLHFGPRDEWLAMADSNSIEIVALPQVEKFKEFLFPRGSRQTISDMVGTGDGTRIVVRNESGELTIVDMENDCVSAVIDAGYGAIDTMAISPNGKWLATGGQELSVRRVQDGSLIATHGMNRRVKSLAWSPDSSSIIAGGDGGVYFLFFKNQPL